MSFARYTDQVAVVTGGAKGLGKAIAERLVSEGAYVTLIDTDQNALNTATTELSKTGKQVKGMVVDVTNEKQVDLALKEIASQHNRLDVVVNSAGIIGPNGVKIQDVSLEDYRRTIDVNLIGSFLLTKYSLPHMVARNYGRILLIASIAGKEGNPNMCAYSSSKGGVIALARSVSKEYAQSGITVNSLCPATVLTPMVESMDPKVVEYMKSKIPMGRFGTMEEIASIVAFYVSPEASFVTGQALDHTGGRAVC